MPTLHNYPILTARQIEDIERSGGKVCDPTAWGSTDVIARWQEGRHFIEVVMDDRRRYRIEELIADRTGGVAYEQCYLYDLNLSDAIQRAARHYIRTIGKADQP